MADELLPWTPGTDSPKTWLGIINTAKTQEGTIGFEGTILYEWYGLNPELYQRLTSNSYSNWDTLLGLPSRESTLEEWCVYQRLSTYNPLE